MRLISIMLILSIGNCPMAARACGDDAIGRTVTVADTIEMTRWADRGYFLGGRGSTPVGIFSPRGDRFIVVLRKGNLQKSTNEYSLLLYQTRDALESPKPEILVTMSSSSNREGIKNVRWLRDGKTLAFLGENAGEASEVYLFDTMTRQLRKITNHPTPILSYDITGDGQEILYAAEPPPKAILASEETRRHGVVITNQFPDDLLAADCATGQKPWSASEELFRQRHGQAALRVRSDDFVDEYEPLSLSPDGRYGLVGVMVAQIPQAWLGYQDRSLRPYIEYRRKFGSHSNLSRYMLLDMANGELSPLLDTPIPWHNAGFAWASDSKSLVVSGSFLPLDVTDQAEREAREKKTFVVEIGIPDRQVVKITDQALKVAAWDQETGILLLKSEDSLKQLSTVGYRKSPSWRQVPTKEAKDREDPLALTLEEDMNTPPRIFVSSPHGERKALLLDLNPNFSRLQFGHVEAVRWQATDGHWVNGGLYLPPNFRSGKRYPLVIQTHGFQSSRFWIDGPWDSAFAAQPLAGNDIIVLQVGYSDDPSEDEAESNTPREGPRHMAAYEGAIDYLDGRGLIDRDRVGIIGFSRTVFRVAYTLTHSRYRFAAATLADGFDGGYVNYLFWGGADSVGVNGGDPFGPGLSSWLRNSPGFNLDKVGAAIRIEEYGLGSFLGGWQWFAGLSLSAKPVDFVWLPFGTHLLVKPEERLASQQGNVDWFRFWLKDEEDTDPAKSEQYARWRELRRLQEQNLESIQIKQ